MKRDVHSRITLSISEPADLVFAIAVADAYDPGSERITATVDGQPVAVRELPDAHGGRLHRVQPTAGTLEVVYDASVSSPGSPQITTPTDLLVATRPSRYAESDRLAATAFSAFGDLEPARELLLAVSSWVGTRLTYVPGSSLPTDGAVETLLARKGVCRDYAHLCVALLRACGVPARLVSVYAPGLDPMDFHAVAEAWVDGRWCVVDATALAPRQSLVRIATGRDAADTAFLNVISGRCELIDMEVTAVADELPTDDLDELVTIS
ncbi:transglutaminase-like domain-containing protein [Microbacterium sp. bgisy189]|uniref:transglutaminase-like domain-containing protein n=1 Tax=Microbacterium sp. bgisy189 TaxID=3413798 RepID=UPI003EBADAA7